MLPFLSWHPELGIGALVLLFETEDCCLRGGYEVGYQAGPMEGEDKPRCEQDIRCMTLDCGEAWLLPRRSPSAASGLESVTELPSAAVTIVLGRIAGSPLTAILKKTPCVVPIIANGSVASPLSALSLVLTESDRLGAGLEPEPGMIEIFLSFICWYTQTNEHTVAAKCSGMSLPSDMELAPMEMTTVPLAKPLVSVESCALKGNDPTPMPFVLSNFSVLP